MCYFGKKALENSRFGELLLSFSHRNGKIRKLPNGRDRCLEESIAGHGKIPPHFARCVPLLPVEVSQTAEIRCAENEFNSTTKWKRAGKYRCFP